MMALRCRDVDQEQLVETKVLTSQGLGIKTFMRPLGVSIRNPVIHFEILVGQQMQVDFTTIRRGRTPMKAFVATLSYSRAAFARFDGVPKETLFDNASAISSWRAIPTITACIAGILVS
ncbi:transposase [Pseudomonas sp. 14A]|nr:transposase [Pseudomonas sp. 14A]